MPASATPSATAVFTGGWIFTGDEPEPRRGGLAVRDGRILTRDAARIADLSEDPRTRRVDLDGRLLVPGFQDAHVHPVMAGIELLGCDLTGCADAAEVLTAIAVYAAEHPGLPWITGAGWSMDAFPGGTPTRGMLDRVVADRPVILENRDHHSAWANSRAFEIAGFDASTPDPPDGRFERESDGHPAGTVHDGAIFLFAGIRPGADDDTAYAGLIAAQRRLLSHGVTAWQDAAVGSLMGQRDTLPVYLRALARGELLARVRGAQWWDRGAGLRQLESMVARHKAVAAAHPRDRFSLGSVKIMVDGVAESRTAAMDGHYRDGHGHPTDSTGMTFFTAEQLAEYVVAIDAAGMQIHFHTLGDRAVRDALDALDAARRANGPSRNRHHLAHLEVVDDADTRRFAELGATANLQPSWAAHDPQLDELVIPFLPAGAEDRLYPFASLSDAGARLAVGSDWPVSSPDPIQALHVGVNRRHPSSHAPRLSEHEQLGLGTLLQAATSGSAYVNHLDDVCGRLREGMHADLAILDRNIFAGDSDDVHEARVDETWIAGERVFSREEDTVVAR